MKKSIAILLAFCMLFALAACGNGGNSRNTNTDNNNNVNNNTSPENSAASGWPNGPVTIYIAQPGGSVQDSGAYAVGKWITAQTGAEVIIEHGDADNGAALAKKLSEAEPDGQTMMLFGLDSVVNYCNGVWTVDPSDTSLFKAVTGTIQLYEDPYAGYALLTHRDNPYNTWEELEAYIKEHPGKVTVMDIPEKHIGIKAKAVFYARGLEDLVKWSTTSVRDSKTALIENTIDIVMLDEMTAATYVSDSSNNVKVLVNCRRDNDFSSYDKDTMNLDIVRSWPTLYDVLGAEFAAKASVPLVYFYVVPADTPDAVVAQMKDVLDALAEGGNAASVASLSSSAGRFYALDGDELMKQFKDTADIVKSIYGE